MTESVKSATVSDENLAEAAEETTQSLREEFLRQGIEIRLAKLDPATKREKPIRWQQVAGVLALIVVLGLLAWGILAWLGVVPSARLGPTGTKDSGIRLISADSHLVLILANRGDEGEVRLLTATTGAILDVSQGDTRASHAALSPQEDTVAYASTDKAGSSLRLVKTSGQVAYVFKSAALDGAVEDIGWTLVQICEWSDLDWSPDADRLAFFGCSDEVSALFVVPARENAVPFVVEGTAMASAESRDAIWLDAGSIALTIGDKSPDSLILIDLAQGQPKHLYGPLK